MRIYNVECTVDGMRTIITVQSYNMMDAQEIVKKMFYGSNVNIFMVR